MNLGKRSFEDVNWLMFVLNEGLCFYQLSVFRFCYQRFSQQLVCDYHITTVILLCMKNPVPNKVINIPFSIEIYINLCTLISLPFPPVIIFIILLYALPIREY